MGYVPLVRRLINRTLERRVFYDGGAAVAAHAKPSRRATEAGRRLGPRLV